MGKKNEKRIGICVVNGVGGLSLYINNYRVAGPKPWGGGKTDKEWNVDRKNLIQALIGTDNGRGYEEVAEVEEALEKLEEHWQDAGR